MERYDDVNGESFVEVLKEQIIEMSSNFEDLLKICQERKQEIEQLKESLRNSKELWLKNEIKVGFLQKELREAHRDLEVAELRLKVMQLEESNARLRERNEEV